MKVWISKYSLTQGLYSDECEIGRTLATPCANNSKYPYRWYHGKGIQWHLTKEEAIAKAEDMRKRKIDSLKKQIAKLEKLDFTKE